MKKRYNYSLSDDTARTLKDMAAKSGLKMSTLIEKAIALYKSKTEQFVEKAKKIHGAQYDYTKVQYINNKTKVCIIDIEFGEFWQNPQSHLRGSGHRKRGREASRQKQLLTQEEFLQKATKVHGGFYSYEKAIYQNMKTPIIIIDPDYGEFQTTPDIHLGGSQHPHRNKTISRIGLSWLLSLPNAICFINPFLESTIIVNSKKRKVDGYDISTNTVYQFHGSFWHGYDGIQITDERKYTSTLKKDEDIRKSGYNLVVMWQHDWKPTQLDWDRLPAHQGLTDIFIQKANVVHSSFYDYSKVEYKRSDLKICIIDPEFGEFYQKPYSHLNGQGHPSRGNNTILTTEVFIKKAQLIHGDRFDYSKSIYVNAKTKICIFDKKHWP